jgi:hypothetical protein
MKKTLLTIISIAALSATAGFGQTVVFSDNFDTSQGSTFTTSGAIGTSSWNVSRSGADWGARIHNNILELTNDASGEANANGWVFANRSLNSIGNFNTTLQNSAGLVTWTLNMRQIRDNPAGFTSNSYGAAFVIGSTSANIATAGNGYAIVLGNTLTPDPIRFVSFTDGIQSLGTGTGGLITASAPLNDPTTSYMSIQLTYNPTNHLWSLYGRNDGASSFADPLSGSLTLLGTVTNSTFTDVALGFTGAYWQGSTAANQTAFFDNISLTAIPEPATWALLTLGGMALLIRRKMSKANRA